MSQAFLHLNTEVQIVELLQELSCQKIYYMIEVLNDISLLCLIVQI